MARQKQSGLLAGLLALMIVTGGTSVVDTIEVGDVQIGTGHVNVDVISPADLKVE
ncbi:hypothetical protein [Rhodococcus sp. A5(2022)]|uniref:hypothetical protein n=1 Tax=Rhodococcus sp. A5(2022) TaxID=3003588 RepID=UPI0022A83999|nr:hypothetical protein [Rhodococcus sp. A5(2022)]MCZ1075611.1 hypothetical protein [Rhodococcus sp. A5(2022)]